MMQARLVAMEEGKEPALPISNQPRAFPRSLRFCSVILGLGIVFTVFSMSMSRHFRFENVVIPATSSKVQLCFQQSNDFQSWIRPPLNVWHRMSDAQLLWRASFDPQIKSYPFERVPKIAFMFLTRGPLPMAPLWERFFKGHEQRFSIYIHALPTYNETYPPFSPFYQRQIPSKLSCLRVVPDKLISGPQKHLARRARSEDGKMYADLASTRREVTEWGMMSMCDAERRLLANALLDISNEWFILLSEACIPLQSFPAVYLYISSSRSSFMEIYDDPGPCGRGRYNKNMEPLVNLTNWRKGSQWFEVDRKLAIDIVKDDTYYPKFEQFCRPACYVDEHYFQTMLSIRYPQLLANRTLTWVDWSQGGPHPTTYTKADATKEFFTKITKNQTCTYNNQSSSACLFFARKFAPETLDTLLEHSSEFFGY